MDKIKVYVQVCREGVELPTYAHDGDSGMDVRAATSVVLNPNETRVVPTGLKVVIPEGYEIQVRPRSGLSLKTPLRICNAPGTIDESFRGEIGVIMQNTGKTMLIVNVGDKVAQLVLQKVPKIVFEQVDDISTFDSDRGENGFGSTGLK